jgi:hypothetical protein
MAVDFFGAGVESGAGAGVRAKKSADAAAAAWPEAMAVTFFEAGEVAATLTRENWGSLSTCR